MESMATVTSLDGEFVVVEVVPADSGCGRCHEAGGCGSSLLNKSLRPQRFNTYRLPNSIGATVGDRVLLVVPEGAVLRAALLAYMLPVVMVIVGAAIGTAIQETGPAAPLGAVVGLGVGLVVLRMIQTRLNVARGAFLATRMEKCRQH